MKSVLVVGRASGRLRRRVSNDHTDEDGGGTRGGAVAGEGGGPARWPRASSAQQKKGPRPGDSRRS